MNAGIFVPDFIIFNICLIHVRTYRCKVGACYSCKCIYISITPGVQK